VTAGKHVIVVGAGIIGASIAWHLTRAGARVTIIDAESGGGVATAASFAWINASWGNPLPYFKLRRRSMAEWRRLAEEVPEIRPSWCGGLLWELPEEQLLAYEQEHRAWGYDIRRVDCAEAARIEPNLIDPPDLALHIAEEGAVEPLAATKALLADAQARGARLLPATIVTGLLYGNGAVTGIASTADELAADEVVLAAGVGTAALAAMLGVRVPMTTPPALLAYSRPYRRLLNGLVMPPGMELRQTADGRIVASVGFDLADPAGAEEIARQRYATVKLLLRGAADLEFDFHMLGYRPMPADGFPIIGRAKDLRGLYLAVTHSGITLAPAVGLFAADELIGGRRDQLMLSYNLARFG
jgi:glycine/D-amino acid oxidase-like deaminating enzyme